MVKTVKAFGPLNKLPFSPPWKRVEGEILWRRTLAKPKIAFYWCASCGGCEEAIVDLAENILKVVEAVEFVLWPVAMDFKIKDVEALKDGEIAVSFINGGIRTGEQEHIAKLLRKKSGLVVAYGACAHLGGIPGLANFSTGIRFLTTYIRNLLQLIIPIK